MKSWIFVLAVGLVAPGMAFSENLKERYFSRDWALSAQDPVAVPPSPGIPTPQDPDEPHVEHAQVAHMYITRKAFELYMAHYPDSELAQYIGTYSGDVPTLRDAANVVVGAYDEDESYFTPFDELLPHARHFWNRRNGLHGGLSGFDSSVNRANKYFTGGYGIDGAYDKAWSENEGKFRGTKGQGAVALHQKGEKGRAYWYLGHAAHLLEDLTVPAHAHLFAHVVDWMDAYETYLKTAHQRWPVDTTAPIESFDKIFDIFDKTGAVTEGFDAGNGDGVSGGIDGTLDRGRRRKGGFTKAELDEEAAVLMPLAYRRVAALFKMFYKRVDQTAPRVTLDAPKTAEGRIELSATAFDGVSGVDKDSFAYFSSYWTGLAWSDWEPMTSSSLAAEKGKRYRFKAAAADAADNVGESAPLEADAEDAEQAYN